MARCRLFFLLCAWGCLSLPVRGQCVIDKDSHGQIVTTCEQYSLRPNNQSLTYAHHQIRYLGSEFLTFPGTQAGTIQLDPTGPVQACRLAYNVIDNNVICLLNGVTTAVTLRPYSFTIDGLTFVRQHLTTLGIDYPLYTTPLHDGPTQLLKSVSGRLVNKALANGYEKDGYFDGYYERQEKFYIRKGEASLQPTTLSKQSLLTILHEQAALIEPRLTHKQLTVDEVIDALTYYDSLTNEANRTKPLLSQDAVFTEFLHQQISYPGLAWNNAVYGRVYAGFDVDELGQVRNITLLSPDNGGFGFDKAVRLALSKLTALKPSYAGRYALPVAFTYTNRQTKGPAAVPVQTLPTERLAGRTLLHELVVPVVVSRPVVTSREVWGYYK